MLKLIILTYNLKHTDAHYYCEIYTLLYILQSIWSRIDKVTDDFKNMGKTGSLRTPNYFYLVSFSFKFIALYLFKFPIFSLNAFTTIS